MSDVAIKVENLSKKYYLGATANGNLRDALAHGWNKLWGTATPNLGNKEFWALKDVSFEVKKGEVVGIIGRNGAGKSTLLKILSRITEPTTGRIELDGRVASLLEVGTGFHPELTGRENIFLNGSLLGMTRTEIKKKFDEIVDFSGVEEFIDTPVKKYSSGMYVRLAFAVAAHLEPEILLVDEVLAVGDFEFQKKCLGKMGEVAREGRTVLLVSHNMGSIQELCRTGLIIEKGIIKARGNIQFVIKQYADSFDSTTKSLEMNSVECINYHTVHVDRVQIINSKKRQTNNLLFGESFSILLEVKCPKLLKNVSIVVGIDTITGTRIFTSVSDEVDKTFNFAGGKKKIFLTYDNVILNPGKYKIYLSFRIGHSIFLNNYSDILFFEVNQLPVPGYAPFKNNWGLIRANPIWTTS